MNKLYKLFKEQFTEVSHNKLSETIEVHHDGVSYVIAYDGGKAAMAGSNGRMWLATGDMQTIVNKFGGYING